MTTELIQLTNQPKPVEAAKVISDVPKEESGTRVTRVVAPRPTPQNTERAPRWTLWILFRRLFIVIRSEVIVAPFPYVALHIKQAKVI